GALGTRTTGGRHPPCPKPARRPPPCQEHHRRATAPRFPGGWRGSLACRAVTGGDVQTATRTLAEDASKALLAPFGVPFAPERVAADPDEAVAAADELGYPVVVKLNGDRI